ncbi:MAG: hypothetical protein IKN16_05940 [Selenomonadaceae bacterium]|nr:hypothetical protein [Selenomonadaceae bacterium]
MENKTSAQRILDNIFDVMQRLYDEMRLNKNGAGRGTFSYGARICGAHG